MLAAKPSTIKINLSLAKASRSDIPIKSVK